MVKVSVIIPIYNGADYIDNVVGTFLNQELKEIELICVNDGSKDNSLELLRKLEKTDDRIIVIDKENGGAGSARNAGIKVAKGEYLAIFDIDDVYEADILSKMYEKAKELDVDMIACRCTRFVGSLDKAEYCKWSVKDRLLPKQQPFCVDDIEKDVFQLFTGWTWDKLFKKEFVTRCNLRFQEIRTSNDLFFTYMAVAKADKIYVMDDVLVHHRIGDKKSLSNTRELSWNCFYQALTEMKKELVQCGLYDKLERSYINYALHFSLWQLNNITGNAEKIIYNKLRGEYAKEFGFFDKPESYFWDKNMYRQYMQIKKQPFMLMKLRKTAFARKLYDLIHKK